MISTNQTIHHPQIGDFYWMTVSVIFLIEFNGYSTYSCSSLWYARYMRRLANEFLCRNPIVCCRRCPGEYPLPGIRHTDNTSFQLWTSSSVPHGSTPPSSSSSSSSSNSSRSRLSHEVWLLTGSGNSSSRPDLSVNPLHLQQNFSFLNRSSIFTDHKLLIY